MNFVHFIVAFDEPTAEPHRLIFGPQQYSMVQVIGRVPYKTGQMDIPANANGLIDVRKPNYLSECNWRRVSCDKNVVTHVAWQPYGAQPVMLRELNMQWLPNTIREIAISNQYSCSHKPVFCSRCLPRDSERVLLTHNKLLGSVDMTVLPSKLIFLNLGSNMFSGVVVLDRLPRSLNYVNMIDNSLERVFVNNGNLPEGFSQGVFFGRKNINAYSLDKSKVDARVVIHDPN